MKRRTITLPTGQRLPLAELRRLITEQREPEAEQPALFEMRHDARPAGERSAAERYAAPSLFTYQSPEKEDPETRLRQLWTEQGVPAARQDQMIAQIIATPAPRFKCLESE